MSVGNYCPLTAALGVPSSAAPVGIACPFIHQTAAPQSAGTDAGVTTERGDNNVATDGRADAQSPLPHHAPILTAHMHRKFSPCRTSVLVDGCACDSVRPLSVP